MNIESVTLDQWHARCEAALAGGGRFLALYATGAGGACGAAGTAGADDAAGAPAAASGAAGAEGAAGASPAPPNALRALFNTPGGHRLLTTETPGEEVPSIIDLAPAAAWDEREAHDLYRLRFSGHEPLRPLVAHPAGLEAWTVPTFGHDLHQVAVGPIHAGVIESGHFRFHVVGEKILHLDLRLFYKHRGLERAAEGRTLEQGLAYAQRCCASCAVSNQVAYAHAAESLLGLWPEPALARARTVLLELERLYNHLNDIGAICAGVGFAAGSMAFATLKERAHRLNRGLTGHRFLFDTIALGRSAWRVTPDTAAEARRELHDIEAVAKKAWHEVLFNALVQDRLVDTGPITAEQAGRMGVVGPAARATGIAVDARTESPRLVYPDFVPAVPHSACGDVASRINVRALEVETTLRILHELLDGGLEPAESLPHAADPFGLGIVESPRGETVCLLEADDGRIARLHLRTSSFANWPALARAAAGAILTDFPVINKSFELCYSCCDR